MCSKLVERIVILYDFNYNVRPAALCIESGDTNAFLTCRGAQVSSEVTMPGGCTCSNQQSVYPTGPFDLLGREHSEIFASKASSESAEQLYELVLIS